MGFQSFRFTVPNQTTQAKPVRQNFQILEAVIVSITVKIPKGHKDVAHMDIDSPGWFHLMADLHGDDEAKNSGTLNVKLFGPPYYINCVGWNMSVYLSHDFIIEVNTNA